MQKDVLLFPKIKTHKKSKHISNKRLKEYFTCEVCGVNQAIETHEIYGSHNRNKSIKYGAQVKICRECHSNQQIINRLKVEWQYKLMEKHHWSIEKWIAIWGKSWI